MKSATAQPFIHDCLRRADALRGLPVMMQIPDDAAAEDIAAADAEFERHLAEAGIVLVVMRPQFRSTGGHASGVALNVCVPVAIVENSTINRSATGKRRRPDTIFDDVIAAVISEVVSFPPGPIGHLDLGDGLHVSYVEPHVRCVIRAARPV